MVIKKNSGVKEEPVQEDGAKDVLKKILIGPEDGKTNIIMRCFKVLPGGNTPLHSHSHEHVVKIEGGKGVVLDEFGKEIIVSRGESLLIEGGRNHQFRNPYDEPFEFLCIIINPLKKNLR